MEKSRFAYKDLQFIKGVFERTTEDYIFIYDLKQDYYMISERASDYFELSECEFYDAANRLKEVIHPDDYKIVADDLAELMDKKKTRHYLEYRWKTRNGRYVWIRCTGEAILSEYGYYMMGVVTEIGKNGRFDNITGLYSENVLESHFSAVDDVKKEKGSMILIGIDNFKEINEKHGSIVGNSVLEAMALIILKMTGNAKQVYRMRGDEFAVVFPVMEEDTEYFLKDLYKKIRHQVDLYIEKNGYQLFFTISAGGVAFDAQQESYDYIIQKGRFALHSAKINGKNNFMMFMREKYEQYVRKIDIQENLRNAIEKNFLGFELYYQPIYSAKEATVIGAEALIRWTSQKYGFMSPVDFIPLLEESSLIIPLGRWIIEQAAKQCKVWCQTVPDFIMHINLSFIQVIKSDIVSDILAVINEVGVDYHHFVFEVTESGEIESSHAVYNVFKQLQSYKFQLAVDDFGTGYSNLRYIKDMVFGIIKIDRTFVKNINENSRNYIVVKSLIEMAHGLNLSVCVEGVETQLELELISKLCPDSIQGFYYGKPVPKDIFEIQHF